MRSPLWSIRAVEVAPTSTDSHVRLVEVPRDAGAAASLLAQLICEPPSEPELPGTDGLVRDFEATFKQQLGDIAKAQLVAEAPQHREQHDVCRVLKLVERRAGSLVEDAPAGSARERAVPERGAPTRFRPPGTQRRRVGQHDSGGTWICCIEIHVPRRPHAHRPHAPAPVGGERDGIAIRAGPRLPGRVRRSARRGAAPRLSRSTVRFTSVRCTTFRKKSPARLLSSSENLRRAAV